MPFVSSGVYAAIDIYGQCVEVDMCYDDHSDVAEERVTTTSAPRIDNADTVVLTHQFHELCSRNIQLTDSRTVASRVNSYDCGIVFSSRRLSNDELFEVRTMFLLWAVPPIHLQMYSTPMKDNKLNLFKERCLSHTSFLHVTCCQIAQ